MQIEDQLHGLDQHAVTERLFEQRLKQLDQYFWIGCSDSCGPANQITGLLPGEMFVHRNVANVVPPGDLNCLSALQFAVDMLQVRHVIVCGHYGCAGIGAVLNGLRFGLVDQWLRRGCRLAAAGSPLDSSKIGREGGRFPSMFRESRGRRGAPAATLDSGENPSTPESFHASYDQSEGLKA